MCSNCINVVCRLSTHPDFLSQDVDKVSSSEDARRRMFHSITITTFLSSVVASLLQISVPLTPYDALWVITNTSLLLSIFCAMGSVFVALMKHYGRKVPMLVEFDQETTNSIRRFVLILTIDWRRFTTFWYEYNVFGGSGWKRLQKNSWALRVCSYWWVFLFSQYKPCRYAVNK